MTQWPRKTKGAKAGLSKVLNARLVCIQISPHKNGLPRQGQVTPHNYYKKTALPLRAQVFLDNFLVFVSTVNVPLCVYVYMYDCPCARTCGDQASVLCVILQDAIHIVFEMASHWSRAHQFSKAGWSGSPRDAPVSPSLSWDYKHVPLEVLFIYFLHEFCGLNSAPHACVTSTCVTWASSPFPILYGNVCPFWFGKYNTSPLCPGFPVVPGRTISSGLVLLSFILISCSMLYLRSLEISTILRHIFFRVNFLTLPNIFLSSI